MKHLVKDLDWHFCDYFYEVVYRVETDMYHYAVRQDKRSGAVEVDYYKEDMMQPSKTATGFKTLDQGKEWAFNHHCEKLSKWLNTDPLTEYAAKFTQWATDRKIIQNGNLQTQTLKLVSEVGELADNIAKGRDTKDDIGDSFVVLNNLVEMQGYTWQECLEQAWNDIKNRTGTMNEHGVFIKDSDME